MDNWQKIYTGPFWAVDMLKGELAREGIPAFVRGAPAATWFGGHVGGLGMADLLVSERRALDSQAQIAEAVRMVCSLAGGEPVAGDAEEAAGGSTSDDGSSRAAASNPDAGASPVPPGGANTGEANEAGAGAVHLPRWRRGGR